MKVIIESPYAGDVETHEKYARECMKDSFNRGEYPFASHLLYTQVLNDNNPEGRELGIKSGLDWGMHAERTVVYIDFGISEGMKLGIENALDNNREVEYRKIL